MKLQDKEVIGRIEDWRKLGQEVALERKAKKLNPLFGGRYLGELGKKLEDYQKNTQDPRGIYDSFFKTYQRTCSEILAGNLEVHLIGQAIDSIDSITKIILFLDVGYGTMAEILLEKYSKEEVARYSPILKLFHDVYPLLLNKRQALIDYLNPFSLSEITHTDNDHVDRREKLN